MIDIINFLNIMLLYR